MRHILFLSLLLLSVTNLKAQLSGTYTIDLGGGGNYISFNAAVADLIAQGVNGPVIFEVLDGLYNERIAVPAVTGASAINTITFRGQSLDSTLVLLSMIASSTNNGFNPNYVLRLIGAQYIIFEHMTIQRPGSLTYAIAVEFAGGASNITLRRCRLNSAQIGGATYNRSAVYSSDNVLNTNIQLIENRFDQGRFAIWWNGNSLQDELLVQGNEIINTLTYFGSIDNGLSVIGNYFDTNITGANSFQAYLSQCDSGFEFSGNEMDVPNATALYILQCNGNTTNKGVIANNMIHGVGAAMNLSNSAYNEVIHNSFARSSYVSNGNNNQLFNNIFYTNTGTALIVTSGASISASNNNCFFTGATSAVRWNSVYYSDIPSLNAATGMDANSLIFDPSFVNPINDLHLQAGSVCAGTGVAIAGIVTDFDSEVRPQPVATAPDIGADETTEYCFMLNGVYVIGPSVAADFPSFNVAVNKMIACGIGGPVVFEVESGTYTEQVVLPPISGNSATNTIVFRGQALDSSLVTLREIAGTTSANNFVISMNGADYIGFEHMTIQRYSASSSRRYARVVKYPALTGGEASQYTSFDRVRFLGTYYPFSNYYSFASIIFSNNTNDELDVTITNSRFEGGGRPIEWTQAAGDDRVTFANNEVVSGYEGLWFKEFSHDLLVQSNRISGLYAGNNAESITISNSTGGFVIERNWISGYRGTGIYLNANPCTAISHGTIRNNMVIMASNSYNNFGIYVSGLSSYLDIWNNSVSIYRGYAYTDQGSGNNLSLVNNIFFGRYPGVNYGYAVYKLGVSTYAQVSNNCLYSASTNRFAYWNGYYADLPLLQTGSGLFANSIEADPLFVDNITDLHLQSTSPCLGAGLVLAGVVDDFDAEVRPQPVATNYEIGADERPEACAPLAGTYIIGASPAADFATFNAAVQRMVECGIVGPVLFQVESGTYNEKLFIPAITGSSAVNTITFQSQTLNNADVTLTTPSLNVSANNYLIRFLGVQHITFQFLTLECSGALPYGRVVEVFPGSTDFHFLNNRVITSANSSSAGAREVVYIIASGFGDIGNSSVSNNTITNGWGIYHSYVNAGTFTMSDNLMTNTWYGLEIYNSSNTVYCDNNAIATLGLAGTGGVFISLSNGGNFNIRKNRISGAFALGGIVVQGSTGTAPTPIKLTNNMIASTSNTGSGIAFIANVAFVDIVHNSVSMTGASAATRTCNISGFTGNDIRVHNNIFSGYGAPFEVNVTSRISSMDNNLFFSTLGTGVQWGATNYNTVPALFAATSMNGNSLMCIPEYYDPASDLHSFSMDVNAAGAPFSGITDDLDGELRDLSTPDIGADEFIPELWTETYDICEPTDPVTSTGSGKKQWIYKDKKVVASFNDNGNVLGTVNGNIYINSGAVRTSLTGQYYLDRNWKIEPQNPITGLPVDIDLYFHVSEFGLLQATDPAVSTITDVGISQYDGPNENCQIADNTTAGTWYTHFPAPDGTLPEVALAPYSMSTTLTSFSEFYITTFGNPLPVELISFTGRRVDRERVLLEWATATETNNEGFEIWRRTEDGAEFENVGWVDGNGSTLQTINYQLTDQNPSTNISYYYLRQVDHNGDSENSEIIAVAGSGTQAELLLYPNPAQGELFVMGTDLTGVEYSIVDASGRLVKAGKFNGKNPIALSELNNGLYSLGLLLEGAWTWERFQVVE